MSQSRFTVAQAITLAADTLHETGSPTFTEWELSVATWQSDKNRFGMRGFEDQHPDHKRIACEFMGSSTSKKGTATGRGWLRKVARNVYEVTAIGRVEAARLRAGGRLTDGTSASTQPLWDAVHPLVSAKAFKMWKQDKSQPTMWVFVAPFLQLRRQNDPEHLRQNIARIRATITAAEDWFKGSKTNEMVRGATGGGAIGLSDVTQLSPFLDTILDRFSDQISAIGG